MSEQELYRRSAGVQIKPVGRSVAAFVREQKALHVLNPTARLILEYLDEPASREELILMLAEATDGREEDIRSDLDEVLVSFIEHRLIERTP
ncbi:MAG: PqqD family protein [Thermoanaerobaculia bacterium]